jgi:hypothetical protein
MICSAFSSPVLFLSRGFAAVTFLNLFSWMNLLPKRKPGYNNKSLFVHQTNNTNLWTEP